VQIKDTDIRNQSENGMPRERHNAADDEEQCKRERGQRRYSRVISPRAKQCAACNNGFVACAAWRPRAPSACGRT
jgi:hypothetical protein